jgi:hypothetical protein
MPRTASSSSRPKSSVPAVRHSAPVAPFHTTPSGPTLGQSIKDGIGLGIGSSIGHRITSAFFGPPTVATVVKHETPAVVAPCAEKQKLDFAFTSCLEATLKPSACDAELAAYTECLHGTQPK